MARNDAKKPLMPSLLDRLIDRAPEAATEAWSASYHDLAEMRDAVRRDLENLLNTRRRELVWPAGTHEWNASVLAYGVPDVTGRHLGSASSRTAFLRSIEELIRRFEPRFKKIRVVPRSSSDALDRTLRFSVEAEVFAEPAPEPITFETVVEPVTRTMKVALSSGRG
jgi:type VI secretion system protein ImpF